MNHKIEKKKNLQDDKCERDFSKEYAEMFSILGLKPENIRHEWNGEGDYIKEFSLYEDHPTPCLTSNTFPISY